MDLKHKYPKPKARIRTITKPVVKRLLNVVDCGLVAGIGEPKPGKMCVEAAVCYALGMKHSDHPKLGKEDCVLDSLRNLKIVINDCLWSSTKARARGMRRLAVAQLGTAGLDENELGKRLADKVLQKLLPRTLRSAAKGQNERTTAKLKALAKNCAKGGWAEALRAKEYALSNGFYAASTCASRVCEAIQLSGSASVRYAGQAMRAAHEGTGVCEYPYEGTAAGDRALAYFAELVVQVLIDMKAPSVKYLSLCK